jgi:hypothetical protein
MYKLDLLYTSTTLVQHMFCPIQKVVAHELSSILQQYDPIVGERSVRNLQAFCWDRIGTAVGQIVILKVQSAVGLIDAASIYSPLLIQPAMHPFVCFVKRHIGRILGDVGRAVRNTSSPINVRGSREGDGQENNEETLAFVALSSHHARGTYSSPRLINRVQESVKVPLNLSNLGIFVGNLAGLD